MLNLIKKKNNFNIQMNVIEEKGETPQCDDCIYEFNGESIIISKEINDIVLNDFNQRFKLIDFSNFDEKNVIEYFYHKEKSNIEHIDLNFKDDQKICKCLKFFIGKLIEDKYQYNTTLINQRNNIEKKLNEILHEIEICADIDNYNLSKAYFKKLKTDKLPKFLEKNIFDTINEVKLINKLNHSNLTTNLKNNNISLMKLGDSLINSYFNLINGDSIPFEGGDKKVLFEIFLYSNLKDIYKSPKMKEIFLYNTQYISECFEYDEGKSEINNVINNRLINELRINKLENAFSKYELINDFHPFILASFFYLIINKMKDKGKNMYNFYNPLMIKILKNVFNNFFMYCYHKNYTNETYTFLFNYFNKLVIQNESDKINKKYEYENIKEKINKSNEFKKELKQLEENIEKDEKSKIDLKTLNNIKLIPLTKKRTSHTITILISGFLSQHDNIDTWSHFYNYEKEYSVYYMLKWPSSYILSFILKILGSLFNPESTFISSYKIAEHVGKILAWFLINNDDFDDCNINLVGFSLGCHIIINCLTELNKFKNKKFVLNNVLLMGGATYIDDYEKYKWRKIFTDNVAGNIINCWSEHDDVLSTLFKRCIRKTPIGSKKIDIKDERGEYSIVDDYEFSDIELGHLNYRKKFEKILKRIHFFD